MTEIRHGMSAADYHATKAASNSLLSDLKESPLHCWARNFAPDRPPRESTPAMRAGTMLHALVLEPDKFDDRYAIRPAGMDGRTKEGKAWAESVGAREIVSADAFDVCQRQRDAVLSVPDLARMLSAGKPEVSVFWTDEATGLECKCRPDWIASDAILDLKSALDVSPEGFGKAVAKYGYHRQRAHYVNGCRVAGIKDRPFIFATVTSAYPFIAVPYMLDPSAELAGESEVAELLEKLAHCQRHNLWPAYGSGILPVSLPAWELARLGMNIEVSYA